MATIKRPQYARYVKWSEKDREYVATFIEIPGLSGLGLTIPEAIQELDEALDAWIEAVGESKIPPAGQLGSVVITDHSRWNEEPIIASPKDVGGGAGKRASIQVDASKGNILELKF